MTTAPRRQIRRHYRRAAAGLLVLLAGLGLAAPASAESSPSASVDSADVTWGIAPIGTGRAHYDVGAAPASSVRDAVSIVNRSAGEITLRVYATDAFTTKTGGLDLLTAAQKPVDAGAWITLDAPTVTLKAQQSVVVPFTVLVPGNATPGDHTAGIVTSLVTAASTAAVSVDRRLATRVNLRVSGTLAPGLRVSDVRVHYDGSPNPFASGAATVTYTISNVGNTRISPTLSIGVGGPLGLLGHTVKITGPAELLPGSSITRTSVVHGVWPATRITATITARDPMTGTAAAKPARARAAVWGWPIGQALLLLALLAFAGGCWWLRRRRARAVQGAIDDAVSRALADSAR